MALNKIEVFSEQDNKDTSGVVSARAYKLRAPMSLGQFSAELGSVASLDAPVALVVDGDPVNATPDTPVTFWVQDNSITADQVMKAVNAHDPAPANPEPNDEHTKSFLAKIQSGEVLTKTDVEAGLRLLLSSQ